MILCIDAVKMASLETASKSRFELACVKAAIEFAKDICRMIKRIIDA